MTKIKNCVEFIHSTPESESWILTKYKNYIFIKIKTGGTKKIHGQNPATPPVTKDPPLKFFSKQEFTKSIVSKEIKAEIGEVIFLSYFLAKRVKSQRGRN